ncbi:MAG: cation transporter dimerization domain-containing protein [Halanaerobiales bacterium]
MRSVIKPFPPGMLKINQLRCRQAGNMIIFDITVVVENDINMEKWSGIYRKITKRLKDKYPNSQVNIIPAGPDHIKNNF